MSKRKIPPEVLNSQVMFPMGKIDGFTLETKVKDIKKAIKRRQRASEFLFWSADNLPEELKCVPIRKLFYLAPPIDAITSTDYLKELNGDTPIADLFTERDERFYPTKPDNLRIYKK